MTGLLGALKRPLDDLGRGLEASLAPDRVGAPLRLLSIFVGLALGWWIYVPIHELFHAGGCLAAGGDVTRLEIAPLYGGPILARLVPWVVSGGPYAGRLADFDTGGSDAVYLVTVGAPYLLTLFPGLWALRFASRRGRGVLFGAAVPWAFAPFVALAGDAYEIGSILVTMLPSWRDAAARELLRGDDLFLVAGRIAEAGGPWLAFAAGAAVGVAWAFATYAAADATARSLGQRPLLPLEGAPSRSVQD